MREGGFLMLRILIVDDEKIERECIKLLIERNNFNLEIAEAENGQNALEHIQANEIDILFTDIKMPFMDGLELSARAREINPNIKIVIYSGFGEFSYAQKAIKLDVIHYILKPVNINEFTDVMNEVIQLCNKEELERKKFNELMEGYKKGISYEKEKTLMNILQGEFFSEDSEKEEAYYNYFIGENVILTMFEFGSRFFDSYGLHFKETLEKNINYKIEYLNLNEYQSIVFIKTGQYIPERWLLSDVGQQLKQIIKDEYDTDVCIVFGKSINCIKDLRLEYSKIEQLLESRFFYSGSLVLFTEYDSTLKGEWAQDISGIITDINKNITLNNYYEVKKGVDYLFYSLRSNRSFSVVYVKYICIEIAKKMLENDKGKDMVKFQKLIEQIYQTQNISELKGMLLDLVEKQNTKDSDTIASGNDVVQKVVEIIKKEYMKDISLESIAERIYLTPSYLSHLFKKETGSGIMKYLTLYRLEKAKDFLSNTNTKIVDISKDTGYTNFAYFCSLFKNYYGITPSEFRKKGAK